MRGLRLEVIKVTKDSIKQRKGYKSSVASLTFQYYPPLKYTGMTIPEITHGTPSRETRATEHQAFQVENKWGNMGVKWLEAYVCLFRHYGSVLRKTQVRFLPRPLKI